MNKILGIITGILGIIIGIILMYCGIADKRVPQPLAIILAIVCIINAVLIIINYKKKRNGEE
ncbi:MAG: hypothetical protein K6E47_04210 [Lachnospiraceae bacterium]|nr:hypothetical protein [Lachnospiraceae bacterium]